MDKIIGADLYRYGGLTSRKGFLKAWFKIPGFKYMYFFRKASKYNRYSFKGLFYHYFLIRLSHKYGFQIPRTTQIGEGFYIGHFGSLVINGKAKIGANCNVAPGVTIGQVSTGKLKGYPTIGDKVWIGTGSVIVGNITIGSNVFIVPNSFVNFDVPPNSLVIGNPGIIHKKENPTDGYIDYVLP